MGLLNPPGGGHGRVGTVVAVVVGLCFVGLIGTLVLRARLAGPGAAGAEPVPPTHPELTPADSGRVEGYNIEIADKRDPTRVAFRIKADATEPIGNRRHKLTRPEAWAYLRDGHVLHVRADQGQVYVPVENQPESGTITGNVVVTILPPAGDGNGPPAPLGVFRTTALTFDANSLELSTLDAFTMENDQVLARGEGLKLLFNEVRQRIEYLQITRGNSITLTPRATHGTRLARSDEKQAGPKPPAARPAGKPTPPIDKPSVETLYQLVLTDDVLLTQQGRRLKADRVDGWVRLVNNRLPDGAIASFGGVPPDPGEPARRSGTETTPSAPGARAPSEAPRAAGGPGPSPEAPDGTEPPVTLTWTGPCTLRPLDSAPAELGNDHAFIRATAEKSGLVTFRDDEIGGGGECAALEYGLTTASLALSGPGPTSVSLNLDEGWSLETARATFDLKRLVGAVPGPGLVRGLPGTPQEGNQIAWASRAGVTLARTGAESGGEGRGGRGVAGALRRAEFLGKVLASDGRASVRSESVRAEFTPDADGQAGLSRVIAEDKNRLLAEGDGGEKLAAEFLDIGFGSGASLRRPEPATLVARGRVNASDADAELACGSLEADLMRDARGKTAVRRAVVRDRVAFSQKRDGVSAGGDEAIVDVFGQTVDISGPDAFAGADQTRIGGPQIRIDGRPRTVAVFGAWTIDHGEPGPDGKPPAHAQGTSGLTFDDRTGKAEGAGNVRVSNRPDDLTSDTMEAERVRLEFTPRPEEPPDGSASGTRSLERKLIRAEAIGGVLERESGTNARVESRRYSDSGSGPGAPEGAGTRRLTQFLYAEGPRIAADDAKGTLAIPGTGLLVLRDHREPQPPAEGSAAGTDSRGDTRFDWDGSMHFDRAGGLVDMDRNVRVTHLRLADKQAVTLVAEHVSARAKPRNGASAAAPEDMDLLSASARGAVYVAVGPWTDPPTPPTRELAADAIDYDAATGLLIATPAPGNLVTVFDSARATPASAEKVTWNVATGQISLVRAQPIVIPR